jgi:hypothetical protein
MERATLWRDDKFLLVPKGGKINYSRSVVMKLNAVVLVLKAGSHDLIQPINSRRG